MSPNLNGGHFPSTRKFNRRRWAKVLLLSAVGSIRVALYREFTIDDGCTPAGYTVSAHCKINTKRSNESMLTRKLSAVGDPLPGRPIRLRSQPACPTDPRMDPTRRTFECAAPQPPQSRQSRALLSLSNARSILDIDYSPSDWGHDDE